MPREVRTSVDTRQVLTPISRPKATEVVARPTDQLEAPAQDQELLGLIQGLSSLNPALQQYAYASRFEQAKDNQKHLKAGAADASMGRELKPGSPEYYKHGYMSQRGQVGAEQSGTEFLNRVATEFDKDTGDFDQFTREHFGKDTHGITDHSYMEGYNQVIPKYIESARASILKYRQETLVAKTETDFMTRMSGAFSAYTNNGMPIPQEAVDSFRKEGKDFFGISGARFNDLRFTVLKSIGDKGNHEVYEALKKPGSDGVPPLYDNPEWRAKIDAAEIHSKNVSIQKSNALDTQAKKEREDRQDLALYGVFAKLDTDPEGARQDYANLRTSGLFSRASELVEWDGKFASSSKREASAGQQQVELDLQQGIYTRGIRPGDIMQADITPAQKRSLMGEWYRVKNDNQQAAANGAKAEDSIFKTQHFKSGEDYIETVLRPQASPLDPMGIGTEFARTQLATARREFTGAARGVKNPNELYGISQEIATRYLDRAKNPRIQKELDNAGSLRYSSLEELKDADRKGLITDPIEFQNQLRYFKALNQNGQK